MCPLFYLLEAHIVLRHGRSVWRVFIEKFERSQHLKGHCIEFKYYADGIHSGLTPPGNNS